MSSARLLKGRPAVWQSQSGTSTGGFLTKQFEKHILQYLDPNVSLQSSPLSCAARGRLEARAAKSRPRLWVAIAIASWGRPNLCGQWWPQLRLVRKARDHRHCPAAPLRCNRSPHSCHGRLALVVVAPLPSPPTISTRLCSVILGSRSPSSIALHPTCSTEGLFVAARVFIMLVSVILRMRLSYMFGRFWAFISHVIVLFKSRRCF